MIERWRTDGFPEQVAHVPRPASALHGESVADVSAEAPARLGSEAPPAVRPTKPRSRWSGRVAWLAAMATVGVLLGLVVVAVLKFIDGPVVATQGKTLAELQNTPTVSPEASLWAGQHAEFKYPGLFDQLGHVKGSVHALEAITLSSRGTYSRMIAVEVGELPTSRLDEDSSYQFRSINPATYTPQTVTIMGEPAVVMVKSDKSERTLFWAHRGKLLTVSLTSDNPAKDNLESYLGVILASARWRQ